MNNYEQQILQILLAVGQRGISVVRLTKHIYNMNSTFFEQPDFEDLHNWVQQYLLRQSKSPTSLIENTGKRGVYRLNTLQSPDARQLVLRFREEQLSQQQSQDIIADDALSNKEDHSLSLFDETCF